MKIIFTVLLTDVMHTQKNSLWRAEDRDGIYNETGLLKE